MDSTDVSRWYTAVLGLRNKWRSWWRRNKTALADLIPGLDTLIANAKASAVVIVRRGLAEVAESRAGEILLHGTMAVGDWAYRAEPNVAQLELLKYLTMAAKALNLPGGEKLAEVKGLMERAWPAIAAADDVFDHAWETRLRPALEELRAESQRQGVW
ncbi:MAG: hypothetical protein KDI48_15935 [Xanthomonadales bacterium]|nr:hypothetical protein [Xanthomonadales bacterium]